MITVNKALKKGKATVKIPALVITYGVMGVGFFLWANELLPFYFVVASIFGGHLLGWIYWSFAITRWRIWAFHAVDDVHELKSRAIASKLIWPDGIIFEKTEIRTRRDKELIKRLETKFNELPKAKQVIDDPSIPPITKVYYSIMNWLMLISVVGSAAVVSYGLYLLLTSDRFFLGSFTALLGFYVGIKTIRDLKKREPELVLDDKGVKIKEEQILWSEIKDVTITHSSNTWLTLSTNHGEINTIIDGLEISGIELKDKMNIYQLRFKTTIAGE